MYKYISKGPDRILVKITEENKEIKKDEVTRFLNCRYLSASESAWKLLGHAIHGRSHAVMKLTCHLPHEQSVLFGEGDALNALLAGEPDTHLTAWFKRNEVDDDARLILYPDFPKKIHLGLSKKRVEYQKAKIQHFWKSPKCAIQYQDIGVI